MTMAYVHGPYWYGWSKLDLPTKSGVYFLCEGQKVAYVGQTINFLIRMRSHYLASKIRKGLLTVKCFPMPIETARALESYLILELQPAFNIQCRKCAQERGRQQRRRKTTRVRKAQ